MPSLSGGAGVSATPSSVVVCVMRVRTAWYYGRYRSSAQKSWRFVVAVVVVVAVVIVVDAVAVVVVIGGVVFVVVEVVVAAVTAVVVGFVDVAICEKDAI